jgi:hypothetical protein
MFKIARTALVIHFGLKDNMFFSVFARAASGRVATLPCGRFTLEGEVEFRYLEMTNGYGVRHRSRNLCAGWTMHLRGSRCSCSLAEQNLFGLLGNGWLGIDLPGHGVRAHSCRPLAIAKPYIINRKI